SWATAIGGDQFNVLHLVKYRGGFRNVDESRNARKMSQDYQKELKAGFPLIKHR
ncbi:NipSnap, partial [Caligus rogercresseyi]